MAGNWYQQDARWHGWNGVREHELLPDTEDTKIARAPQVKAQLKALCTASHPLSGGKPVTDVIAMLRPDVIVCSAADAWAYLAELGVTHQVLTIAFHQQLGSHALIRDIDFDGLVLSAGTHMDVWSQRVHAYLDANDVLGESERS